MFLIQAALLAFTCAVAEGAMKCTAVNGMDCVFPFKRPGSAKEYTELAPGTVSNKHWCATKVKGDLTYDTWSYARKDDCDFDNVDDIFETFQPKEKCLYCLEAEKALACTRPCITDFNRFTCFSCLLESNARYCIPPCIGVREGGPKAYIDEAASDPNVCSGIVRVRGPYGALGTPSHQFAFNDRTSSSQGLITQVQTRTGSILDQFQITYGTGTITHGGAGGASSINPAVNLIGLEITKIVGYTNHGWDGGKFGTTIQAIQFHTSSQEVFPIPGTGTDKGDFYGHEGQPGDRFSASQPTCFLAYLSGFTTGNQTNAKTGNYVSQLRFHFCCPK